MFKVTLVGLGKQNLEDHIPAVLRNSNLKITGCYDPVSASVATFKEKYVDISGGAMFFSSITEISSQNTDIAIVAVPHDQYIPIINHLVKNQIYFMKEKPLSRDINELDQIEDPELFKKLCFVCTQRRFNPLYQEAYDHITKIGAPFMFNASYMLNVADPEAGWRGNIQKSGGGCILDMGYHIIDQLTWWFGSPDKVHAYKSSLANGVNKTYAEDAATIVFEYKNGLHGYISLARSSGEKSETYSLHGSNGHISGNKKTLILKNKNGDILLSKTLDSDNQMLDSQLKFFVNTVLSKGSFKEVIDRNIVNMQLIERLYKNE